MEIKYLLFFFNWPLFTGFVRYLSYSGGMWYWTSPDTPFLKSGAVNVQVAHCLCQVGWLCLQQEGKAAGLGLQDNWILSPVAQDLAPALQEFLLFFFKEILNYWALSFLHPQVKEYFISLYFNKEIQSTQQVLSRVCQGRRNWVGGYCSPSLALSFKCSLLQESNTLLLEVNTLQDFPNWHIKQLSFKCYEKGIKSSKTETTSPH